MDWLTPEEWQAVALSLKVSFWAVLASLPLGILCAYALARWRFPGRQVLNGLVHLPLILPPVVTGYLLLLGFGRRGLIGAPRAKNKKKPRRSGAARSRLQVWGTNVRVRLTWETD